MIGRGASKSNEIFTPISLSGLVVKSIVAKETFSGLRIDGPRVRFAA
jgi:hypothetical protein